MQNLGGTWCGRMVSWICPQILSLPSPFHNQDTQRTHFTHSQIPPPRPQHADHFVRQCGDCGSSGSGARAPEPCPSHSLCHGRKPRKTNPIYCKHKVSNNVYHVYSIITIYKNDTLVSSHLLALSCGTVV